MFVGRKAEFAELERRYMQDGFQFPVVYGRRRVGKTRLIQEFASKKKSIYFMATKQTSAEQLRSFSSAIKEQINDERTKYLQSFESWESLFTYITDISKTERLVLVIDEYPYLAESEKSISSVIQKFIDNQWKETQLYLILCGSSMSFMEEQVLEYGSPLYGRRTAQLKIHPLPYYEAFEFFPDWSETEKFYAYGICGGVPLYLEYFSRYRNLKDAVCGEFLSLSGHLSEEPMNLMSQELREPAIYNTIISVISKGATKQNEIASLVGTESNRITAYIKNLLSLEIIEKHSPVESHKNKVIYKIKDNLFRFYFRFIPQCSSLVAMGIGEKAYDMKIYPLLDDFFGHIFEDICMQYLKKKIADGEIKTIFTEYGSWWGNNPKEKRDEEIDLVLTNEEEILVGECKWRNEKVGIDVVNLLKARGELVKNNRKIQYIVFSKSGFTADCIEFDNLHLVTAQMLAKC
ncbi:MAG: ATP-binding protein [Treponema sp.]|nr:ATP-binding protein [Treponema sp.]